MKDSKRIIADVKKRYNNPVMYMKKDEIENYKLKIDEQA
jgi:hypothetical protein